MKGAAVNASTRGAIRKLFPVFVLPAFISFVISFLVPFVMGVYLSLCDFNIPKDAHFTGFQNYVNAFCDAGFWNAFANTALFALVSVVAINVPAFFLAYALSDNFKGVAAVRSAFFMPNLIGGIVLGYIWSMLFDAVLKKFGTYLTAKPSYGFFGLVILVAWQQIGYMMIIYIAGFKSIPGDMLEAASVDGAGGAVRLFKVILSNMSSSIFICTFLSLTNGFKLFDQNLALTGGAPIKTLADGTQIKTTELLAMNIYSTYNINRSWHGTAEAKAFLFFILVGAIASVQLIIRKKTERDDIK